jgi:predicted acylesterase/phospholipase RssA
METPAVSKLKECDLVMKGGVTSGIVYPPAVIKLSEEYRFRAIGGTSAGAIAAAATAAAEYGREKGGFVKLDEVRKKLSVGGFLEGLFQPSGETRPLIDTLKAMQKASANTKAAGKKHNVQSVLQKVRMLSRVLRHNDTRAYRKGALVGSLINLSLALLHSVLAFFVFWLTEGQVSVMGLLALFMTMALPFCFTGYLLGGIVGSGSHLYHTLTVKVPENFFGLCSGRSVDAAVQVQKEVLTDWLSLQMDNLAGIADEQRPLTFGRLKQKGITLRMMTSNLSQSQPYVLPFESNRFIFSQDEFARLFPEYILDHLIKNAYQSSRVALPPGYHFLPVAEDLPVAVALRLSLSFPLLISAVPLYTISLSAFERSNRGEKLQLTEEDIMLNWFSDGGISSNFPIQFFDAWLPRRPTFGIKLEALPPEALRDRGGKQRRVEPEYILIGAEGGESDEGEEEVGLRAAVVSANGPDDDLRDTVYLPKANAPLVTRWKPLTKEPTPTGKGSPLSLTKFVWSIFETAQNYRDNMQSALSSYRERIVQIRLRDDEGGLNLMMPNETIDNVMRKGLLAGETLLTRFNFEHHQWVRFRVLMAQLEENLMEMKEVLRDDNPYFDLQKLMSDQLNKENRYPYARDEAWRKKALERIEQLRKVVGVWERPVFSQGIPKPEPVLRITPEI